MRVAIVGSRECGSHIKRSYEVLAVLRSYPPDTVVISGGAWGIDTIAKGCAEALGLAVVVHPADWKTHGRKAGFLRNKTIVDDCDEVHAWWDGKSRGTQHTINLAGSAGKRLTVHRIDAPAQEVKRPKCPGCIHAEHPHAECTGRNGGTAYQCVCRGGYEPAAAKETSNV